MRVAGVIFVPKIIRPEKHCIGAGIAFFGQVFQLRNAIFKVCLQELFFCGLAFLCLLCGFHFLHFGHNFFQEQSGVLGEAEVEQHFHRQVIIVDLGIEIHLRFLRHIVLHQIIFQLVTVCDNACALERIFHCVHNVGFVGVQ